MIKFIRVHSCSFVVNKKIRFISWLCLVFLSTFFVGCNQQKPPIVTVKKEVAVREKIAKKSVLTKTTETSKTFAEELKVLNENMRSVIVNVTSESNPVADATVTLTTFIQMDSSFYFEKQTDKFGTAEFLIPKTISLLSATAFSKNYAAENKLEHIKKVESDLPISINLTLKNNGVNITAVLVDAPEEIKKLNAQIVKTIKGNPPKIFVVSTNISGNKITFPPIASDLKNLQVSINGENIPLCLSEKFNTKKDEDKEVFVEVPLNVTLKGKLFDPDGFPITNKFSIFAKSTDMSIDFYKNGFVYNAKIQPKADGSYEKQGFGQGFFSLYFKHSIYKDFRTNLCLLPPETELNFSFNKYPTTVLNGLVILETDKDPVAGITVHGLSFSSKKPYVSAVTDKDGKFSIKLKSESDDYSFGRISIDESGFGKVIRQISKKDKFIKIVLRQAGNIIGNVLNEKGEPIPDFRISIHSKRVFSRNVKNIGSGQETDYNYYNTISDNEGHYAFNNIVAPEKYGFASDGSPQYSLVSTTPDIELKPEETIEQDLIVKPPIILALKAIDRNNNPVLEYAFTHSIRIKNGSRYSSNLETCVDISDNAYYYFNTKKFGEGFFSCSAFNIEKGLMLITNNIPFSASATNYITLIFDEGKESLNLTGTLLNPNGKPAKDVYISCWPKKGKGGQVSDHTDNNGYFELRGLNLKKGDLMGVDANSWNTKCYVSTNLPSGTQNIIIKLNPAYKISGRVFLDNLETPAENFTIKCSYNEQSYNSKNGSFVFALHLYEAGNFVTVLADKYLPSFVKGNFENKINYDAGNIILKKGGTGKIQGKVVNQNGKPVAIKVHLWSQTVEKDFNVFANESDGSYVFEEVPSGKCKVSVKSKFGLKALHKLFLKPDEELEVPNLVLNYTNSAYVTFSFKLSNGSAPGNSRIINNGFYIKSDGTLSKAMKVGDYSGWKIKFNDKIYVADDFVITEMTDRLEVQMLELTE